MKFVLAAAAFAWPLLLGSVVVARPDGTRPAWTGVVYLAGSRICHQLPARSFHTDGVQWPVCARCAGLYLSAPLGAIVGLMRRRRTAAAMHDTPALVLFAAAAIPTALTLAIEGSGLSPLSNLTRAVAALPLGATTTYLMMRVVSEPSRAIG